MTEQNQMTVWLEENGVSLSQWKTAALSLFPGVNPNSIRVYFDYCKARHLDPMKKPAHIVPMRVKNTQSNEYEWRDVVMPGIYEYRTTAQRTGVYAGQDDVVFGDTIEYQPDPNFDKVYIVPEYAKITVYRLVGGHRCAFTGTAYFSETCATKKVNKTTGQMDLNSMWSKRPRGQLAKCAEADALRKAFPDELGGEMTIEEMEGKDIDSGSAFTAPKFSDEQWDEFNSLISGTNPVGYFIFLSSLDTETSVAITGKYKASIDRGGKGKEMKRLDDLYSEGMEKTKAILELIETTEDDAEALENWESLTDIERDYMLDNLNPAGLAKIQQLDLVA